MLGVLMRQIFESEGGSHLTGQALLRIAYLAFEPMTWPKYTPDSPPHNPNRFR
jgi:hypothetical protein